MGHQTPLHPAQPHGRATDARQEGAALSGAHTLRTPHGVCLRASAGVYGHIIRLLILTGQRVGQFSNLRREWIGSDTITWPAQAMKGNREHTIPIGPLTQAELEQFPLPSRSPTGPTPREPTWKARAWPTTRATTSVRRTAPSWPSGRRRTSCRGSWPTHSQACCRRITAMSTLPKNARQSGSLRRTDQPLTPQPT